MPTLTPQSAGTETLSVFRNSGFFPGTYAYSAPYAFPGSTSYPGDGPTAGTLSTVSETALTLSTMSED